MTANEQQREYWSSDESRHWVEEIGRYDAQLAPYAEVLLSAADLGTSDHVLDVGCGTGTTTMAAAARASEGDAVGVDISEPMIACARERARRANLANVTFRVMDAQSGSFERADRDAVVSRFGVMFFDDPVAAFTNIASAMRPGARLVFVCWQELAANEWMMVPGMAAAQHTPLPDLGTPGAPGPFAFGDPDRVRHVLMAAGFEAVDVEPADHSILLGGPGTLDDAVAFLRGTGMARAVFADATPDAVERAVQAVRDALAPYETPAGVEIGAAAWLVTARAPDER